MRSKKGERWLMGRLDRTRVGSSKKAVGLLGGVGVGVAVRMARGLTASLDSGGV